MKPMSWVLVALALLSPALPARAGPIASLSADWSDASNPNTASFGTWSYRQGSSLLPEVPNWTANGTAGFTATQPAWAPSNTAGNYLPAEFKATSVPTGVDWQVGDVVLHTTDPFNGGASGSANYLWTSPNTGTVTISGSVWAAETLAGRDNSWSLLVNGNVVSSGASIDPFSRANPFLFSNGSGGIAALTQNVTAGSTIDLQITRTTAAGYFVGANLTITEADAAAVPEPNSLIMGGIAFSAFAMTALARRIRKG